MAEKRQKGQAAVEAQFRGLRSLNVVYVATTDINPNSYNPNRQSEEEFQLLLHSMRQDGFTQPILVHKEGNVIVDGEHRWRAAKELGIDKIPVVFVDFTKEQMRLSTLRHNRARGSEDMELTAALLKDLQALGALNVAVDALHLDMKEVDRLLEDTPISEGQAGAEWSEAWVPTASVQMSGVVNENRLVGTTPAVQAMAKRTQQMMATAGNNSEAASDLARDYNAQVFRINVVFSGEEAALVRTALGDKPSERMLAISERVLSAKAPEELAAIKKQMQESIPA